VLYVSLTVICFALIILFTLALDRL
jgi:hypothetical protein